MASLDREWVANGPGKAAESAAYDIAIDAEAAQLNGEVINVTVAADLHKEFERVQAHFGHGGSAGPSGGGNFCASHGVR